MSRLALLAAVVLAFMVNLPAAQAAMCCAHWGADGVCYHEYVCSETSDSSIPNQPNVNNDVVYTRNEDGNLQRSCCAHWGADGVCYHEYACK